jgi:hypothetical protein
MELGVIWSLTHIGDRQIMSLFDEALSSVAPNPWVTCRGQQYTTRDPGEAYFTYAVKWPRNASLHHIVLDAFEGVGSSLEKPDLLTEAFTVLRVTQKTLVEYNRIWIPYSEYILRERLSILDEIE